MLHNGAKCASDPYLSFVTRSHFICRTGSSPLRKESMVHPAWHSSSCSWNRSMPEKKKPYTLWNFSLAVPFSMDLFTKLEFPELMDERRGRGRDPMQQSVRTALWTVWSHNSITSQSCWYSLVLHVRSVVILLRCHCVADPWGKCKQQCSLWSLHGAAVWWVSLLLLLATFAVLGGKITQVALLIVVGPQNP